MSYPQVDTLNGYQSEAAKFAQYGRGDFAVTMSYHALKLASEAGEVAGKIGKHIGHGKALRRDEIAHELGDVLWHLSMMARDFGFSLNEIANANLHKLGGRVERGTIVGDGDNR